jgi:hypothetical protein
MAITRTAWTDDDGSGTTGTIVNNAEKTILYNQIDAADAQATGTWTPTDASGAGLSFSVGGNVYAKAGNLVFLTVNLTFPVTASAAAVHIGGLPYSCSAQTAGVIGWTSLGVADVRLWYDLTGLQFQNSSGTAYANSACSGKQFVFSIIYATP